MRSCLDDAGWPPLILPLNSQSHGISTRDVFLRFRPHLALSPPFCDPGPRHQREWAEPRSAPKGKLLTASTWGVTPSPRPVQRAGHPRRGRLVGPASPFIASRHDNNYGHHLVTVSAGFVECEETDTRALPATFREVVSCS